MSGVLTIRFFCYLFNSSNALNLQEIEAHGLLLTVINFDYCKEYTMCFDLLHAPKALDELNKKKDKGTVLNCTCTVFTA